MRSWRVPNGWGCRLSLVLLAMLSFAPRLAGHTTDVCWLWAEDHRSVAFFVATWHAEASCTVFERHSEAGAVRCSDGEPECLFCPLHVDRAWGASSLRLYEGSQFEPCSAPNEAIMAKWTCRGYCSTLYELGNATYHGTDRLTWYAFNVSIPCGSGSWEIDTPRHRMFDVLSDPAHTCTIDGPALEGAGYAWVGDNSRVTYTHPVYLWDSACPAKFNPAPVPIAAPQHPPSHATQTGRDAHWRAVGGPEWAGRHLLSVDDGGAEGTFYGSDVLYGMEVASTDGLGDGRSSLTTSAPTSPATLLVQETITESTASVVAEDDGTFYGSDVLYGMEVASTDGLGDGQSSLTTSAPTSPATLLVQETIPESTVNVVAEGDGTFYGSDVLYGMEVASTDGLGDGRSSLTTSAPTSPATLVVQETITESTASVVAEEDGTFYGSDVLYGMEVASTDGLGDGRSSLTTSAPTSPATLLVQGTIPESTAGVVAEGDGTFYGSDVLYGMEVARTDGLG
ncbi:hypothetical protein CYMTET_18631, partial [Cymbomonas tetramitiformis]